MGYKYIFRAALLLFFFSFNTYSQVGIGNTNPDSSSLLEIGEGNDVKGILIPRVSISDLNTAAPVDSPTESLLVYNTNTVTGKGYVYWNGAGWQRLGGGSVKLAYEEPNFLDGPARYKNLTGNYFPGFGAYAEATIYSHTITLSKPTLVEIKALISVQIKRANKQALNNDYAILYGMKVTDGLIVPGTKPIVSDFKSYTKGSTTGAMDEYFNLGGSGYVQLDTGPHTLYMYVVGQAGGAEGFNFKFTNLEGAYFQVIYHD